MEPSKRIDSWNAPTCPERFFYTVNHGVMGKEDDAVHGSSLQTDMIQKAYRKINNYMRRNKVFLNADDAERVCLLAGKVASMGLTVNCKDPKLERKLNSIAYTLRKRDSLSWEHELETFLPSDLVTLVGEYVLPLEEVLEALAHGQFVGPKLIAQAFSNPSRKILQPFINKIYDLRNKGGASNSVNSIRNFDAAVAYIRTFCREARRSSNGEKWLALLIQCLDDCKFENSLDAEPACYHMVNGAGDTQCIQIANWIVESEPPSIGESEYLKALKEFIERYDDLSCECIDAELQLLKNYVDQAVP